MNFCENPSFMRGLQDLIFLWLINKIIQPDYFSPFILSPNSSLFFSKNFLPSISLQHHRFAFSFCHSYANPVCISQCWPSLVARDPFGQEAMEHLCSSMCVHLSARTLSVSLFLLDASMNVHRLVSCFEFFISPFIFNDPRIFVIGIWWLATSLNITGMIFL